MVFGGYWNRKPFISWCLNNLVMKVPMPVFLYQPCIVLHKQCSNCLVLLSLQLEKTGNVSIVYRADDDSVFFHVKVKVIHSYKILTLQ